MSDSLEIAKSRGILLAGIGLILIGIGTICQAFVPLFQSEYLARKHREALFDAVHSLEWESVPGVVQKND